MADPVAGRAAVVGGSLGGLNAALWLADAGWDVEVLERSRSPLEGRGAEPFVQLIVDVAVPRMVFGRICLLGDAAFALRPHAAVGTAKAAEDAWQLARALQTAAGDVDGALIAWEESQLQLGRQVAARTCEAGNRSQFDGTWKVGEPLPFGLYEVGDSAFAGP